MKKLFLSLFFTFSFILLPIDNVEAVSKSAVKRDCKLKNFRSGVWKIRIDPRNTTLAAPGRMFFETQFTSGGALIANKTSYYDYYNSEGDSDSSDYGMGFYNGENGIVVRTTSTGKRSCQVILLMDGLSYTNSSQSSGYAFEVTAAGYAPGNQLKKNDQGTILLPNGTVTYGSTTYQADIFLQRIL